MTYVVRRFAAAANAHDSHELDAREWVCVGLLLDPWDARGPHPTPPHPTPLRDAKGDDAHERDDDARTIAWREPNTEDCGCDCNDDDAPRHVDHRVRRRADSGEYLGMGEGEGVRDGTDLVGVGYGERWGVCVCAIWDERDREIGTLEIGSLEIGSLEIGSLESATVGTNALQGVDRTIKLSWL